jgi:periplasmic protein TonB
MNKKMFVSVLSFIFAVTINAQVVAQKKKKSDEDKVFEKVSNEAHPNEKTWINHINKCTQLPDSALKNIPKGKYEVSVRFVVDIHGSLGQIKALNDPGFGLANRAENIISSYNGSWQPANQCGRNVKAYRKQLITFIVPSQ